MQGKYKKFDHKLYRDNDNLGKKFAKHFLPKIMKQSNPEKYNSVEIRENSDKYGPDLCCYNDGELIGYFEPEIKHNWNTDKFPFNDLQIPERKAKWANGHNGLPVTFCVLSKPSRFSGSVSATTSILNMATVTGKNLIDSPTEVVSNKYVPEGERSFKVPLNKVQFHEFAEVLKNETHRLSRRS